NPFLVGRPRPVLAVVDIILGTKKPRTHKIAVCRTPAGNNDREVNRRTEVNRQPARFVLERVEVVIFSARIIDIHLNKRIGAGVQPYVELELLERLPLPDAAFRALGMAAETVEARIAMLKARI